MNKIVLSIEAVDKIIWRYHWFMNAGFVLCGVSLCFDTFGVVSGFMAVFLGACGGMFGKWKAEQGLWMASLLFIVISFSFLAVFVYFFVFDAIRGRLWGILATIEMLLSISLLLVQNLFLWTITRYNWHHSRALQRRHRKDLFNKRLAHFGGKSSE